MTYRFVSPRPDDVLFDAARDLGDENRRFVGMLPFEAWRDYAEQGHILVAVDESVAPNNNSGTTIAGYTAYRTPRDEVVIAHLVVNSAARGKGVARALVEELSRTHARRRGIAAVCRADFAAHSMWPRLSFVPLGSRPGRGRDRQTLTYWWRDHGHADLMTWSGPPASVLPVVMDANVFLDLHGENAGGEAERTRRLLLDVLGERLELLVTPEVYSEIDRRQDAHDKARLRSTIASQYPRLAVAPDALERQRQTLVEALGREPTTLQDRSDLAHIAYASAAGVSTVVTRDNPVLRRLRPAALSAAGVTVVSPEELVTLVDEAEAAPAYMPAALLGTGYTAKEAGSGDDPGLRALFSTATGERLADFERRARLLAGHRPTSARLLISDPSDEPIALLGLDEQDGALVASMLRMNATPLQATLAAQVGSLLRSRAAERGVTKIRVDDPYAHPLIREALQRDGYYAIEGRATALTLPQVIRMADLPDTLESTLPREDSARSTPPWLEAARALLDAPSAEVALALERQLRPLCIVDAPVPVWLVPIKPKFSAQLFGYPQQLLARPDELGMSVEHVYYRGGRSGEAAPARVLWYVSGPRDSVVMGRSELVEVVDGPWDTMYRRYRRLGVYRRSDVEATADRQGNVRALRIINTEVFDRPLSLQRLRRFATETGASLQLQSPWRVPPLLFARIIREVRA